MSILGVALAPIEPYIWAALVLLTLGGGLYVCHRLEAIGANQVKAADASARADEQKKVAAQTVALQVLADKAAEKRDVAQKALTDYMAAHPVGHVFVCRGQANSGSGLPKAASSDRATASSSADAGHVGQVSGGSEDKPIDIGPALDVIVRSAGAVSGLYRQSQVTHAK